MAETQPQGQSNAQPALVLYDADAQQRVPMETERRGKLYKVAHLINPISRDTIVEHERARKVLISDAETSESDDADARAIGSQSFEAALSFYDKVANGTENYSFKNPDNWKEEVSRKDKFFVVSGVLLAIEFVQLPLAAESEACPADDEDTSTYRLRCPFDGHILILEHALRAGSADDISDFVSIMSRALLVQGAQFGQTDQRIPSRALALEALYDRVKVETKGYANRVPLHHKMAVVLRHFRAQQKLVAKK
jgi:hypothetical protein